MSLHLEKLKKCNSISDFIREFNLGLSAKQVGYIIYGLPDHKKYDSFEILKSNGGLRTIHAPKKSLKFLQKQFSSVFLQSILDIQKQNHHYLRCNHAFEKNKSIISNARHHQKKKFLLNIDISDFFGSIHYGRIKNFLINDKYFSMTEKGASIIAKLAVYQGKLPQGSPLSPILATLIGNLIDVRLTQIAKKYRLTYTRYADDISFSSNCPLPEELVYWDASQQIWVAGKILEKVILKTGFLINPKKTRYTTIPSRQLVTGIVVNMHTNAPSQYRKQNRAMVNSLLQKGEFYIEKNGIQTKGTLNQIIGRLNHTIYAKYHEPFVDRKLGREEREKFKEQNRNYIIEILSNKWHKGKSSCSEADHQTKLLRNVLFYKYFNSLDKTKIFTEGVTDSIYFQIAAEKFNLKDDLSFQKTNISLKKLGLKGGVPTIESFFKNIENNNFINLKQFRTNSEYPAIFILDYDQGLDGCPKIIEKFSNGRQYCHITRNIYVLLLKPYNGKEDYKKNKICIENLIRYKGGQIEVDGAKNENVCWNNSLISKMAFSKYISNHKTDFDFTEFKKIFDLIQDIERDYSKLLTQAQAQDGW